MTPERASHNAARWTLSVAKHLANVAHLPIHEAAPLPIMLAVIELVESGRVNEAVAKKELPELIRRWKEMA